MERHVEEELHPILTPEIDGSIHAGSRTGRFIFRQTVHVTFSQEAGCQNRSRCKGEKRNLPTYRVVQPVA